MGLLGFFILLSTFMACDTYLFAKGYRSFFHECKTDEEKKIHARVVEGKAE